MHLANVNNVSAEIAVKTKLVYLTTTSLIDLHHWKLYKCVQIHIRIIYSLQTATRVQSEKNTTKLLFDRVFTVIILQRDFI